ncbi:hypothetical protein P7H00_13860 [Enterococcus pseudoavium]|uniref:DUF159 family protein n=1 Tax=Enterococcus pseudoavium TaxID=44007 RepID=A0AAE4I5U8_9ENTE|nr:hypothetical protein [Enterococcus pseudoavium]
MCGRYFFDLSSDELKSYYDHVVLNATGKHIRVGFNEIFPTNYTGFCCKVLNLLSNKVE